MRKVDHARTLQINADEQFQRRSWVFQRIGWVFFALFHMFLLAGALGLFGNGPLSKATMGGRDGAFQFEYDRFARLNSPTTLTVRLSGSSDRQQAVHLRLAWAYLRHVEIEHIYPEPTVPLTAPDGLHYTFAAGQATEAIQIKFAIRPERFGWIDGEITLEGRPLRFAQLVYP